MVEHRADTPGLWFSAFRLPEAEWGQPDDVLAMSWYMTSELQAHIWYSFIWCERIRVLHPDDRSLYQIPNEPMRLRTRLVPLFPEIEKQRYPMVCVINGRGDYGIYYRESEASDLEWYTFQQAPRLSRVGSAYRISQPKEPAKAPTADATLGCLACYLLDRHMPACQHPRDPSQQHVLISEDDARSVANFLDRHPDSFADTTRLLWRRLADHYSNDSVPLKDEQWSWKVLTWKYQDRKTPDRDYLIRVLPEREQMLVLGSYTKPDNPYDQRQENARMIKGMLIERSKERGLPEPDVDRLFPAATAPADQNE